MKIPHNELYVDFQDGITQQTNQKKIKLYIKQVNKQKTSLAIQFMTDIITRGYIKRDVENVKNKLYP